MYLLASKDSGQLPDHPRVGVLQIPARPYDAGGRFQAADNGCYNGFDEPAWLAMLDRLDPEVAFVTVPDEVGDYQATRRLWDRWSPTVVGAGFRPAYVAQDGETSWPDDAAVLFIGGTTEWKESEHAERLVRGFPGWTHIGRVNTARRARLVNGWGADSLDGSGLARFPDATFHLLVGATAGDSLFKGLTTPP